MAWQVEPTSGLAGRFVDALRGGSEREELIRDVLIPELNHSTSPNELVALVEFCAEKQSLLRERYTSAVGYFCLRLIDALAASRCESWPAMIASLRLLEGVVLLFMTGDDERPHVCSLLQHLLKVRFLPRNCVARLECALMSLSEPLTRSFCAEERVPNRRADDVESELLELAASARPSEALERQRNRVYELFDKVINECFGVHGKQFGSAVNGFQTTSSDIDIMVLLPHSVQEQLIAEAIRKRDEGLEAVEETTPEFAGASPSPDWSFLASKHKTRVASVAAARSLSVNLRRAGLHVTDVIEAARVPLVKCKHVVGPSDDQASDESTCFEVDISFCNEVAWFNSHLLRAYAEFDERAMQLGVLIKLWAKRRKINSAFEGTLSSYSYVLLVIHYLQYRGILPNLQRPQQEILTDLGSASTERVIEGGHNVWFVDPQKASADSHDACAAAGRANLSSSSSSARNKAWWVGSVPPRVGILDLLYGFFRYFALEFNVYADVVSIRWRDPPAPTKMDYFLGSEEDEDERSEVAEEDIQADVEEPAPEDSSPMMQATDETLTPACLLSSAADCGDEALDLDALPSASLEVVSGDEAEDQDATPETFVGRVKSYSHEDGRGSIHCPEARAKFAIDVMLPSSEWDRANLSVGCVVQFSVVDNLNDGCQASNVQIVAESTLYEAEAVSQAPQIGRVLSTATKTYPKLPATLIGTVKTYKPEVGYGFINCPAVQKVHGRDTFLHKAQAGSLAVGDRVSFLVERNAKGHPQARHVSKVSDEEKETDIQEIAATESGTDEIRTAQRARLVEKRLKNRQCLCIDDPMERNRTLGVTFSGQEAIAHELRRALSAIKRGGEGAVEAVFKEKSEEVDTAKKHYSYKDIQRQRDYSPTPLQSLLMMNTGQQRVSVEVERPLRRGVVQLVIGKGGATIKQIKESSGCEDIHVNDTKIGPCLYLKGFPLHVQKALELAEQAMSKQRPRGGSGGNAVAQSQINSPQSMPVSQNGRMPLYPIGTTVIAAPISMGEYVYRPPQPPPPAMPQPQSVSEMAASLAKPVRQRPMIDTTAAPRTVGASGMLSTTPPPEASSLFSSPHASMKLSTSPMMPVSPQPAAPSVPSMSSPPGTPSKAQPVPTRSHQSKSLELMNLLKANGPEEDYARVRTPPRSPSKLESSSIASSLEERIMRSFQEHETASKSATGSDRRPPDSPYSTHSSQPSTPHTLASTRHPPGAVTMTSIEARMELQASIAAKQQTGRRWSGNRHSAANEADRPSAANEADQSLKNVLSMFSAPPEEPTPNTNQTFLRDPVILQRGVPGESEPIFMREADTSSQAAESSIKTSTSTSVSREAEIADRRKKGTKIRS